MDEVEKLWQRNLQDLGNPHQPVKGWVVFAEFNTAHVLLFYPENFRKMFLGYSLCLSRYNSVLATVTVTASSIVSRFIDKGNGTIYDTVSNLTWLKNADCFGRQIWDAAVANANIMASGQCGLSDGSRAGDWHLPTIGELRVFVY